ncbi:MAG: hypothetical protein ACOYKZ_03995 [Chlamydiia bacterium]
MASPIPPVPNSGRTPEYYGALNAQSSASGPPGTTLPDVAGLVAFFQHIDPNLSARQATTMAQGVLSSLGVAAASQSTATMQTGHILTSGSSTAGVQRVAGSRVNGASDADHDDHALAQNAVGSSGQSTASDRSGFSTRSVNASSASSDILLQNFFTSLNDADARNLANAIHAKTGWESLLGNISAPSSSSGPHGGPGSAGSAPAAGGTGK